LGIPGIDSVIEIGRSVTHTTYQVRDVASGRELVIKLLNAGHDWPGLAERFEREQAAMAALGGHPNIVAVLGYGWTETGMPYIVTGGALGGSIADRLRGPTPMTGPDILSLGVRLAGALESAHRAGVVHGDLRPADMMLSPNGEPLLADFGVVTLVRPSAIDVTDPAELAHVAPELLDGEPATFASDLYALTSALFTLFNGLPAYVRPGDQSIIPVIKRIASDPLPDLAAKNVPIPVIDALSRGMSKDPADRHHQVQDFGRSLQQAQVALGLPMTEMVMLGAPRAMSSASATGPAPVAATPPAPAPPGPVPPVASSGPPSGTPASNRRPLIIGGVVAAVVIVALIAFLATRGGESKKVGASASSSSSGTTTRPTNTTATTGTTDTTLGASGAGTALLTNNGGQLEVNAPTAWSDVDGTATSGGAPHLQLSTNLAEFTAGTYNSPGIELVALDPSALSPANLDAALDAVLNLDRTGGTLASACTRGTRTDFVPDGANLSSARLERLSTCGGGGDVIITAATDTGQSFLLLIEVHVGNPPDDLGVDDVMTSFNVVKFP
jgi:hypothetical protein